MKEKQIFFCDNCGFESAKWQGKCPACGQWNTFVESTQVTGKKTSGKVSGMQNMQVPPSFPVTLREVDTDDDERISTGIGELDRVLGGGAVVGSLNLVGGEPGIGKSTLLLQICNELCAFGNVLYVSGEESRRQIKMRADRLGVTADNLFLLAETNLEKIISTTTDISPRVLIVDSIQTVFNPEIASAPGSVTQIKDSTMAFMQLAKSGGITIFIVGHVNKDGAIAGPKVLEHMVDCVLNFEGDRSFTHRILRAEKNRFGSTNEIGVFEMGSNGLDEVPNPSQLLLSGRPENVPGSCVACVMEGSRPVLAEIQALVAPTAFGNPRRMTAGLDYSRSSLLLAVLEKRAGYIISNRDVYINVVGGLKIDEPAADLPAILSVASACTDKPVRSDVASFGEVGLAGELRSVTGAEHRLSEIKRLGFSKCIVPARGAGKMIAPAGLEIIPARSVSEAIIKALG
ncbi:MAG: DNA repair protein RadA [Oscillospiraceae bacterium]|nr:DNA repair protein RadA [Oscillospiraceae bacterium]